ncbi:MAG: hypothetical protein M3015_04235 [Bacteroidota bacterium]|nr:hypothetical protein [Bacteroidota bacterium]
MEDKKAEIIKLKEEGGSGMLESDPETLHTPDPQEHMEGPVSSLMHGLAEGFDDKNAEKKIKEEG